MRISSTYFSNNFLVSTNKLQQQQLTLQNEATTGLKVTNPEDDPAVMTQVLNLQTAASNNAQYQANITSLQNTATDSYSAMSQLQSAVTEKAATIASNATNSLNASQLPNYASSVQSLIQQALQIANTQDAQGNYLFAGTAGGAPYTASYDASGNITGVTYNGNSSTSSTEIAKGQTATATVPGANTTGSGPAGLFTDSRSGADLFNHLLSLQQDLTSGNTAAITSTDVPALAKDNTNVTNQIATNAAVQATLSNASTAASTTATNLTTQVSNLTSADLATTITQLQQTQTAYQAALESGTQIFNLSILNYLQ